VTDDAVVNQRLIRRSFDRAAAGYDAAAVLQNEICRRMLSRLDYVRHAPRAILDAGSGTGNALSGLHQRYPQAALCALDISLAMLMRSPSPWWMPLLGRRRALAVCGNFERLPLRAAAFGMVWSNLALQWSAAPARAFAEVLRVLEPGGLFLFSTFGPDTLKELRDAYRGVDPYAHVNRFIDMHDLGDMLLQTGFADPVMDMEAMTLTYTDVRALMRDLKAIGARTVTANRRPAMTGRRALQAVEHAYEAWRRDGRLPATFEIVYGQAWKAETRVDAAGRPVIPIKSRPA
jgi:malonyl-CoA O-methyltransferase